MPLLCKATAAHDYAATQADALSFSENAIIGIIAKNGDGWFYCVIGDRHGLCPGNHCEELASDG